MSKKLKKTREKRGKQLVLSIVFLVLGFMLAFSYRTIGSKQQMLDLEQTNLFQQEEQYRADLIEQQERNKELTNELLEKQKKVHSFEQDFSDKEKNHAVLVEKARDLRLLLGDIPSKGAGIKVTLEDADYDPSIQNPNDYIVHESHVLRVINELKIAGAQGMTINGQRINSNSYIKCTGPVIMVDGRTFPAPFIIEAVGDPKVLSPALHLKGSVIDGLLRDNIVVTLEEMKEVQLPAIRDEV
ncbi:MULTISPECIES: DUF881 domain-containing protein [unclassified Sporosarcina]|uniref:DUF881 domain-containing protein n=1 Tax=unclassified Sporosarcina TaxID=2647733 RepID=UPI000C163E3D|nr:MULTISPECIES: DUF881 domain-containing protein [unclassified Sporosarcina]PID02711.1 hypothetical protein CSV67_06805 [Sporosarcina sp. P2]PID25834.1 hypothetical protein CSV60_00045 [Sporosarcina sp. P7]